MKRSVPYLLIAAACLAVAQSATSATRTVTNLNDSGAGSLRDAIAASGSGDTINFSVTGTIALSSGELDVNHNLTITGPGPGLLSIYRSSSSNFRIFYFDNGTWTLSGVTIANGHDTVIGGGIYNGNGNLTLNNCVFQENVSGQKGGGLANNATTTLNSCVFALNRSDLTGGAIHNSTFGTLTMHDCTFQQNASASDGGGVFNDGSLNVFSSTFFSNTGSGGGAIYFENGAATVQDCTFWNNEGVGNALRIGKGNVTVQSCTFSENDSDSGGTIYLFDSAGSLRIGNTILAGNSSASISVKAGSTPTITSLGYNLSNDGAGGYFYATGDQINTDPVLDPRKLQDNGGPTKTIALGYGSPAIDRGKNFGIATDQRGNTRTYDNSTIPNAPGGDGTDIGAFEAGADPGQAGPTLMVTNTLDHDDGVCGGVDCTLREAINRSAAFASSSPPPIAFASNVTGTLTVQSTLVISAPTVINGPGARTLAISGGQSQRIFSVNASANQVQISGLTLRDGIVITSQNHGESRQGGAILNGATLELDDCALTNNAVSGALNIANGGNGGSGQGGAICNQRTLTLNRCAFSGNAATGHDGTAYSGTGISSGGSGGAAQGGAVFNDSGGLLIISTCTFNANSAGGGAGAQGTSNSLLAGGGNANGAAICNLGTGSVSSCTISGNIGAGGAGAASGPRHGAHGSGNGGLSSLSGSFGAANTIVAQNSGNTAPDIEGTFGSDGYNLLGIGDQGSGFTGMGDQVGTGAAPIDPRLGQLANNGGATDTMRLLYGSPALDRGKDFGAPIDQRGRTRPVRSFFTAASSDGNDIGAMEVDLVGGPDSDGDGMSDDFEFFFGMDATDPTDAMADFDHDGLTNRDEFQAGTNPLDGSSTLRVTGVARSGSDIVVTFATVISGRTYQLVRKDSLTDSTWNSITGVPLLTAQTTGSAQITDPNAATSPRHFYRIQVIP